MIKNFDFTLPVRVKFGAGSLDTVGQECLQLGAKKVLLTVDSGLLGTSTAEKVRESLKKAGVNATVFSDFTPEPAEESVASGLAVLQKDGCEVLIGLGGGSAMDMAKSIAIAATIPGPISTVEGLGKLTKPALPVINIPTTAGTGSEVSSVVVLEKKSEQRKYVVKSPFVYARLAILDPDVLLTLPKTVAANSGIDAIIHAIESYISTKGTVISDMFAITALKLLAQNIRPFVADRANKEAGTNMIVGSMLAGVAMAQSALGVVHALAVVMGARRHIPHGLACALFLCDSMEAMTKEAAEKFADMARVFEPDARSLSDREAADRLPGMLHKLLSDIGIESGLRNFGVTDEDMQKCAQAAEKSGIPKNSPATFTVDIMVELMKRAS